MVSFESQPYSKRLLQLISWSHWFTFFNVVAAILLSSIYIVNESFPNSLLGQAYLITTWLSHMAFLTFISFVLLLFPIILIYPRTRFIRVFASIIFSVELLLLLLDAFIYAKLGYHLNTSSISPIITVISEEISQNTLVFSLITTIVLIVILAFELTSSNYAWKHLKALQETTFARLLITPLVVFFFFSHIIHIWADANLNYDILKQDTSLPLSYPTTAKALLTKYGMFDPNDYQARKSSPLSFTEQVPPYPTFQQQCANTTPIQQSVFMVLTDNSLTTRQVDNIKHRVKQGALSLTAHIDNANNQNAWFNLFYSLPTIYKNNVLASKASPLLFQAIADNALTSSFTIINEKQNDTNANNNGASLASTLPTNITTSLFDNVTTLENISSLLFADKLNNYPAGLHLFYFKGNNSYQFQLFVDALVARQYKKPQKDIVFISSVGNQSADSALSFKPSLLILPKHKNKTISHLTSHMDIQATLMKNWLHCPLSKQDFPNGTDINTLTQDRILANTTDNGIMVFNKDKSIFIDQNGNFQSYSIQLSSPITVKADFPMMINGVHFIKKFTEQNKALNK